MIIEVPTPRALTIPEDVPIAAVAVVALVHVPPADASLNVAVKPLHIMVGPVMATGNAPTVTVVVTWQLKPFVKAITAFPGANPDTMPVDDPTEAVVPERDDQVPPVPESVIVSPLHTNVLPVIGEGDGLTVTLTDA